MERPTCKTCPYFVPNIEYGIGECRRYPPSLWYVEEGEPHEYLGAFSETYPDRWCGEHPNFPAYLASLKPPYSNDDLSQHEKLRDMLKSASLEELDQILKILSEREREIIKLSFGLAPYVDSCERSHIARIFKITRERARYIEDKAVKILMAKWIHSQSQHIDKSESRQT